MPLEKYRAKRDFARTPEPEPGPIEGATGRFVVQRHRASRLHYDLRLEIGGVLVSWAVPRGPTLDPGQRRMAARTEDHPIEYLTFEGAIPAGEYGAGDMIVWDWGTFEPEETGDPAAAIAAGELKFRLHGERLRGRFTIIHTGGRRDAMGRASDPGQWLLIHKRDEAAVAAWDPEAFPTSVRTGRTNDEVAAAVAPRFEAPPPEPEGAPDLAAAQPAPMPDFIPPMLATLADGAFDDPDWLFEVKWDGYRIEAVIRSGETKLWTRRRVDAARYAPELVGAAPWIAADEAIVDGEIVALDAAGNPSFGLLQERTGLAALELATRRRGGRPPRAARDRGSIPLAFMVFDLLYFDGRTLLDVPLEHRKRLLRRLLRPDPVVRFAGHVTRDGEAFMRAAAERGLEGVVAKRRQSRYLPGRRDADWLKVKLRREQELVVVGWLPRQGSVDDIGSLVVAVNGDDGLRHAGQIGSGLDRRTRAELRQLLETLRRPDPALAGAPALPGVRWVDPQLVIRAEFAEWTADGLLRAPAFKGVEPDRDPAAVVREDAVPVARLLRRSRPARHATPAPAESAPPESAPLGASAEELKALDAMDGDGPWAVAGQEVRLTNLDKELFPADGAHAALTKRDLIRYYVSVGTSLVPHLATRGLTLQRFPNGVNRPGFWQKDLPGHAPSWVKSWTYVGRDGPKRYVVADRVATLAWLAQEGAVELHPWTSTIDAPDRPSYALIDIDPGSATTFDEVLVLARLYRSALEHLGVTGLPKVTGQRGIQIWVPIARRYTFDETRGWVEALSRAVGATVPDLVSWEWSKRDRKGRARLDYTQNAVNKTLVAPYGVRPAPGGPVSAPIRWDELEDETLRPDGWTLRSLPERLRRLGDLFAARAVDDQELPAI
jgi:bifunctional non-homologous end joining protein LigD